MTETTRHRVAASVVVRGRGGKILLVREADPRVRGALNLPGGHVDRGETLTDCARRELHEETGLSLSLLGLLGVYVQGIGVHFVFLARSTTTDTTPGDDILSCEWLAPEEIATLPDGQFLRPKKLRAIIGDLLTDHTYPIELIHQLDREAWEKTRGGTGKSHPAQE